jgi:broad specificity phosphatase PhoE
VTRLILVRHGHVAGIEPPRFRGGMNLPLTERGLHEAQLTAVRIAKQWQPAIVYSSPKRRCIATAQPIAAACGVACQELDDISDLDYGAWQDKTHAQVREAYPALYRRWLTAPHLIKFPEGSSLAQLSARVTDALRLLLDTHADATVVVVGHDSGHRTLLLHALGLPLAAYWRITQDPCGLSEVLASNDGLSVRSMNDTAHLAAS